MKLQYSAMGSMGTIWIDAQDRYDEFSSLAQSHYGVSAECIEKNLLSGREIKTGPMWDSAKIRDLESTKSDKSVNDEYEKIIAASRKNDGYGYEDGEY